MTDRCAVTEDLNQYLSYQDAYEVEAEIAHTASVESYLYQIDNGQHDDSIWDEFLGGVYAFDPSVDWDEYFSDDEMTRVLRAVFGPDVAERLADDEVYG